MSAITISRQAGSEGDWIAEQVAQQTGFRVVNKATFEKVLLQYGVYDFMQTYDDVGFWSRFDPHVSELANLLSKATIAMVSVGNIILVGRGGFGRFKNFQDVLNVRIQAPLSLRVLRVMADNKMNVDQAEDFIRQSDHIQQEFLESVYGSRWNILENFDLLVDTSKVMPAEAVKLLVEACEHLGDFQQSGMDQVKDLAVDPVMLKAVNEVLQTNPV